MCEGKFLVKTNVTTDNVIRQVTVENFRFGIRVIKKPEGRWVCQDLNNSEAATTTTTTIPHKSQLLQILEKGDDSGGNKRSKIDAVKVLQENRSKSDLTAHENHSKGPPRLDYLSSRSSSRQPYCKGTKATFPTATATLTCSPHQGPTQTSSGGVVVREPYAYCKTESCETSFSSSAQEIPRRSQQAEFRDHRDLLLHDFSGQLTAVKGQRSGIPDPPHYIYDSNKSILYERLRHSTIGGAEKNTTRRKLSLLPFPNRPLSLKEEGEKITKKKTTTNTTTGVKGQISASRKSLGAAEDGFKNQYLSKILGSSPLLKLQLLNLTTVVPLNDQHKVPDLLPVETITRLRMLFDDDGSEKSESGGNSNSKCEKETKRMRETSGDGGELDVLKRVKVEPEEDGNLVIDENMGSGEELSDQNSEESNDDGGARSGGDGEADPLDGGDDPNNCVPGDATGKRSNSASSSESSSKSCSNNKKKNGLDAGLTTTRVPKLPSSSASSHSNSNSQSSAKANNNEDCNVNNINDVNATSNSVESVSSKVLRLEKEIAGLTSLLKLKEAEWNSIVRLKKLKELAVEYLRRQRDVEQLTEDDTIVQHEEYLKKLMERIGEESGNIGPDETDVRLNLDKTEKEIKETEKKLKNSRVNVSVISKDKNRDSKQNESMENFKASLALQQLCERNRSSVAQSSSPVHLNSNTTSIQNKVIGEGRQGTIVEVRSIIADYRSKNPEETGQQNEVRRRNVQKKSTTSQPKNSASSIIAQNQNVSFKDVLVNLAKLSQSEKAGTSTSLENIVTTTPRGTSKNSNNANAVQANSFGSQRGQVATTLAKLLSSNSTSGISVGVIHPDEDNSGSSLKIESVNNANDGNLSLANLLASSKCRDDDIKAEDDEMVPICQGCNSNRAQFVCAGCGNQWYCCRECQVQAWEDHSEICSG